MNRNLNNIRQISHRLAIALSVLVVIAIFGGWLSSSTDEFITAPMAAFAAGIIGGFVGLQRRLKSMSQDDLELLANSWVYVCLSPLVGGVLAVVLYVLFISELVSGHLFPEFVADCPRPGAAEGAIGPTTNAAPSENPVGGSPPTGLADCSKQATQKGFSEIFKVHGQAVDYAKMMVWSFVAGFSERFVTDIISKFESSAEAGSKSGG